MPGSKGKRGESDHKRREGALSNPAALRGREGRAKKGRRREEII